MRIFHKVFFIVSLITVHETLVCCQRFQAYQIKSRKKRSLIFPKGTVIQLVYCYLMSALGTEGILTVGVTLGTNWDVPVDLEKIMYNDRMKITANRRDRRSLYPRIEYVLNQSVSPLMLKMDGKLCIKKLLCNSRRRFNNSRSVNNLEGYSFIEEIIHIIFLYPNLPQNMFQPIDEYDNMLTQCEEDYSYRQEDNNKRILKQ